MALSKKGPLLFSQQHAKLNQFLCEEGFSRSNLDKINYYSVTPLTLALDSKAANKFVKDLLALGANPVLENCHGYTPLQLASHNPELYEIIKKAIRKHTCIQIKCEEGAVFTHAGNKYKIKRVVRGGSSSIKVFEIEDLNTNDSYMLKVKHKFNGLELRNYILLHKYVDLFPIKYFMLGDLVFENVYALKQKVVPGLKLSLALKSVSDQAGKDQIICQAIIALCNLHKRGLVHRDALPDNCLWDPESKRAEFIDYDIMRTDYDLSSTRFAIAVLNDFKRLILGCITRTNSRIKGLNHYTPNIEEILQKIPATILDPSLKAKIKVELLKGLNSSTTGNAIVRKKNVAT